jgi:hypothetical protein
MYYLAKFHCYDATWSLLGSLLPSKYHRTKAIKGRQASSASAILISLERKGKASGGGIQGRALHTPCLPPARERIITGITNGACHVQPWQQTTCEPREMMPMIMAPFWSPEQLVNWAEGVVLCSVRLPQGIVGHANLRSPGRSVTYGWFPTGCRNSFPHGVPLPIRFF